MLHERRPLNRYWMTCNEFQPVLKAQQSSVLRLRQTHQIEVCWMKALPYYRLNDDHSYDNWITQGYPKQKHTLTCQLSCILALFERLASSCRRTGSFKTIAFSKVYFLKTVSKIKGLTTLYFTPRLKWLGHLMMRVSLNTTWSNFWALKWSTLKSLFISCLLFSGVYYIFASVYFKVCAFGSN